jgi:DNA polymerase (family 10)
MVSAGPSGLAPNQIPIFNPIPASHLLQSKETAGILHLMDNITLARLLDETASLLEIDGADLFRIRSYRRAAEAVEQQTTQLSLLCAPDADGKVLLAIPGIGKGMAANLRDLVSTGSMPLRDELLTRYKPTMLDLLRLPGMGPKTVAMLYSALGVADIDALEAAAKGGDLLPLPRLGAKFTEKLLKGIEDYRKNSSRFRIDVAREHAQRISELIRQFPGIETITPAGSLRRGRETCGDLDLLVTGPACEPDVVATAVEHVATLPLIDKLLARGQNKVSFTLRNNLQVDVRLLPRASYGAALQYFTGSKHHNVALRQRAIKRGLTLSEYALMRLEDNVILAAATEQEIYNALDLDYIPPELRENCGEIEAAAQHRLPKLITRGDMRGDLHMHTFESDGTHSIREMAEAALARGIEYIAITDHSKLLAMTNGMDDARTLAHAARIRQVSIELQADIAEVNQAITAGSDLSAHERLAYLFSIAHRRSEATTKSGAPSLASETWVSPLPPNFRILAGVEVDILLDGTLDLTEETLAQLDIVVASVHSGFNQTPEEITARVLRAAENPHVHILGHPTGRKVLKREPYKIDLAQLLPAAARLGVAVEHNAAPARSDLSDLHLRQAKEAGCKIVANTDAHTTDELDQIDHGIVQLRRAWLSPTDVLNTLPVDDLLNALRRP